MANICPVPPGPEHGPCDLCAQPAILTLSAKHVTLYLCDGCREYFHAGFNVEVYSNHAS